MGYIKHHAIVVTSFDRAVISEVNTKAIEVFGCAVSGLVISEVNQFFSFFIGPDGSSEHWSESNDGDFKRFEFIAYLQSFCYGDGSSMVKWVELTYADDKGKPKITNNN